MDLRVEWPDEYTAIAIRAEEEDVPRIVEQIPREHWDERKSRADAWRAFGIPVHDVVVATPYWTAELSFDEFERLYGEP